ncbi:MAG: hypothetical protein SWH68_02605 [Thermodesulfobacteriota bacterium]|nr:hypothetical protein [Thermodesulfobacteriota bacterium]
MGLREGRQPELDRMAAMLSRLGGRGYQIREDQAACSVDFDPDSDFDPEKRKSQQFFGKSPKNGTGDDANFVLLGSNGLSQGADQVTEKF